MTKINLSVDKLFPEGGRSGKGGKKLNIDSLFGEKNDDDYEIEFSSDILIEKIEARRKIKLKCFNHMLKYCYDRIMSVDNIHDTDMIFTVVDMIPECKDYDSLECLEFISVKLREQDFDTIILSDNTMFITWKYIEIKKMEKNEQMDKIKKMENVDKIIKI
jgi:hypothetical protein